MKTTSVTPTDIKKKWVLFDAKDQTVGRLASEVARILRGKNKVNFVPHLDCGDNVVIINAEKVIFTGRKWDQKFYYRHSSFIGGIKATSAKQQLQDHPERILEHAIKGMLPHNKLGRKVLGNCKIYAGTEHPHDAQKPVVTAPVRLKKG